MKIRNSLLLAAIVPLASCGGGGGSGGNTGGVPTPAPTATATPTPTPTPTPTTASWEIDYPHIFAVELPDGAQPSYQLTQASDGRIYGTTLAGGLGNCGAFNDSPCGTVYRMAANGDVELLHLFSSSGNDGYNPSGGVVEGSDGKLYGVAALGGEAGGGGIAYRMNLDGSEYEILHHFGVAAGDGYIPRGKLVEAPDGYFYGTTASGGTNFCVQIPTVGPNCGTIFRISPTGDYQTVYSFGATVTGGVQPNGGLLLADDGNFYGTTESGGANRCGSGNICGTFFRMTPAGEVTIFHDIASGGPVNPKGGLIQASDGLIYGVSTSGGNRRDGTIFRFSPGGGNVTVLYSFGDNLGVDGSGPHPLIEADDGAFYSTTQSGGPNGTGAGTAFRFTKSGEMAVIHPFGPLNDFPHEPLGALIQADDGALYGVTRSNGNIGSTGALRGFGTLFRLRRQ